MTLALIAGGGTGGHLSIAIAMAQAMAEMAPQERIVLAGCRMETDQPMLRESGFPFCLIPARPWPTAPSLSRLRRRLWNSLLWPPKTLLAILRSLVILRRESPLVVIGAGGYGSVPPVVAAWLLRLPILIHEPDAVAGLANRFLARFAKVVTLGYSAAAGDWCRDRAKVTGNPVRRIFFTEDRQESRQELGVGPQARLILVVGGSQGSRTINQAILGSAPAFLSEDDSFLLHVSGWRDYARMRKAIDEMSEPLQRRYGLHPFLSGQEMAKALLAADVVVTRGGASALAEVAAAGLPAIILPYPYARGRHQATNARDLVESGQAVLLEDENLETEALARVIQTLAKKSRAGLDRQGEGAAGKVAALAKGLAEGQLAFRRGTD